MTEEPTARASGKRTVLVLDDDDALRRTIRRLLELYDYTVLEAAQAHAAIEVVTEHTGPIDLILCDLVLPGLGGREAASTLMARRPEAKVLYMSGYSSAGSFRSDLEHTAPDFLAKPFEVQQLLDAIAKALG